MVEFAVIFLVLLMFVLTVVYCWFVSEYNTVLARKFPERAEELSVRFFVSNFGVLKRFRKAIKLNDPELTKIAKKAVFVTFSMVLCVIGLIVLVLVTFS
jgi:hypothetical protein